MKLLKVIYEHRAYTRNEASEKGYTVGAAGYTYKSKKKKNVGIVAEAWIVKCVAIYEEVWDEGEGEGK